MQTQKYHRYLLPTINYISIVSLFQNRFLFFMFYRCASRKCLRPYTILQFKLQILYNIHLSSPYRICNEYEKMAARASESPDTTAQLVELINYILECRDCAMFDLREKARTTAEHVMFLMEHAHLHCKYLFVLSRLWFEPQWRSKQSTLYFLQIWSTRLLLHDMEYWMVSEHKKYNNNIR